MTLCLLVGGPDDGRFLEFDHGPWHGRVMTAHAKPVGWHDLTGWEPSQRSMPTHYDRELYGEQKIACPDYWTLVVYVHPSVDLNEVGEDALIDIVMRHWRELNRRKAERLQHAQ